MNRTTDRDEQVNEELWLSVRWLDGSQSGNSQYRIAEKTAEIAAETKRSGVGSKKLGK